MTDTERRPYRAGLGLPKAVVIRSHQPIPDRITTYDTSLEPQPHKDITWREWAINPARHGPERAKGPPVFVPIQGRYDELGRSIEQGAGVEVDDGQRTKRDIEGGDAVAEWYSSLSSRSASVSRNASPGPSRPRRSTRSRRSAVLPEAEQVIDLTADSDDEPVPLARPLEGRSRVDDLKSESPAQPSAPPAEDKPVPPAVQINWFTRPPAIASTTKSDIGSMINITGEVLPRVMQPNYVLGPENKGYALLKDKLGWHGGGLGRPDEEAGPSRRRSPEILEAVLVEEDGREYLDLTAEEEEVVRMGPGRTAPISTALKMDRLGVGHVRATRTKTGESNKKVTHSHKEILEAQRRARYTKFAPKLELNKKGKIKWRDKDKRDRDDRRRIAAALNR